MGMGNHQVANLTVSEYLHVDMSTAALKQRSRWQKQLYCITNCIICSLKFFDFRLVMHIITHYN